MKFKLFSSFVLVLTVAFFHFFSGCTRVPNPTVVYPVVPPQVILSNGSNGNWFGNTLTNKTSGFTVTAAPTTAISDPISGDSSTLVLSAIKTCGYYFFSSSTAIIPTGYNSGHLQFDIMLGQPVTDYSSIEFHFSNSTGGSNESWQYISPPATLLNNLSDTNFTHVSLPISSFLASNGSTYEGGVAIDYPFEIKWCTNFSPAAPTTVILDNIIWTAN